MAIFSFFQIRLRALTSRTTSVEFHRAIKDLVGLHTEMIVYQNKLADLSVVPTLILEFISYGLLLIMWIIVFFLNDLAFLGLIASANLLPYFVLIWMNERLADAYDELRQVLYAIEWYNMSTNKQKALLQIIIIIDCPKLLSAGTFHLINYEGLADMLNRVYSYGLFINNLLEISS